MGSLCALWYLILSFFPVFGYWFSYTNDTLLDHSLLVWSRFSWHTMCITFIENHNAYVCQTLAYYARALLHGAMVPCSISQYCSKLLPKIFIKGHWALLLKK